MWVDGWQSVYRKQLPSLITIRIIIKYSVGLLMRALLINRRGTRNTAQGQESDLGNGFHRELSIFFQCIVSLSSLPCISICWNEAQEGRE